MTDIAGWGTAKYQIWVNEHPVAIAETTIEVWSILEEHSRGPFGSRYQISSTTGADVSEFTPF